MKIYISDLHRETEIYIYGVDGEEATERFIEKYFEPNEVIRLSESRRKKYNTDAMYAISGESYEVLAQTIERIQNTIDMVAEELLERDFEPEKEYADNSKCFVI